MRYPVAKATLYTIIGAFMILPVGTEVNLPLVPNMDKSSVPNLAAFIVCRYILGKKGPLFPHSKVERILLIVYVTSPFITAMLNQYKIVVGPNIIKEMEYYDSLSEVIRQVLFILPFVMGFNLFRTEKEHELIIKTITLAGLIYSAPMLIEVVLSPQLHTWIYGYFPHSFEQQIRAGGFRPVVFMGHGLIVAFFTLTCVIASMVLVKARWTTIGFPPVLVFTYLLVFLMLCKSMASIIYAIALLPIIYFSNVKSQLKIAVIIVLIAILYPLLRGTGSFPREQIYNMASEYSLDRANSFDYRMKNEELLLKKANDKAFFGWGSWGRNRIYDLNGHDISVTDGRWIIVMGQFGWIGLIAEFGLLAWPVIRCVNCLKYIKNSKEKVVFGGLCLILAVNMFDLIPNSSMTPITWLIAGALIGRTDELSKKFSISRIAI